METSSQFSQSNSQERNKRFTILLALAFTCGVIAISIVLMALPHTKPKVNHVLYGLKVRWVEVEEKTIRIEDGREIVEVKKKLVPMTETASRSTEIIFFESPKDRLWLYLMIGVSLFVGFAAFATLIVWFYLLFKGRDIPPVLTELFKYFVTGSVSIMIGFLGGYEIGSQSQKAEQEFFKMENAPPEAVDDDFAPSPPPDPNFEENTDESRVD
ncbi:MAG: hypothetical protein O2955_08680 [Planctomycetota bacterium]|nr:hypothetical protein [Planctomycetota bacterium]MDA1212580.1 hypothetical protein [Planctomycetota bacterium]